jgi:hypothetical protein
MGSPSRVEHFVTLFDSSYLPMGMALHESLMAHSKPFCLWIICMDEKVEEQLSRLALPHVTLLPLREVETQELLAVKPARSLGEYCWTLTPFSFEAVFDRGLGAERVTYLDSDLFFFSSPQLLLRELEEAGKHVLITEHAYAPDHAKRWLEMSGRFCVQFLTFRRTAEGGEVMRWWQNRCLEWCFARFEEGKFGDQKYLDQWLELFAKDVHVVHQTEKTLAPWNAKHYEVMLNGRLEPVFFHFHGFRILSPTRVRLYYNYSIGREGLRLYDAYLASISNALKRLNDHGIPISCINETLPITRMVWHMLKRRYRCKRIR